MLIIILFFILVLLWNQWVIFLEQRINSLFTRFIQPKHQSSFSNLQQPIIAYTLVTFGGLYMLFDQYQWLFKSFYYLLAVLSVIPLFSLIFQSFRDQLKRGFQAWNTNRPLFLGLFIIFAYFMIIGAYYEFPSDHTYHLQVINDLFPLTQFTGASFSSEPHVPFYYWITFLTSFSQPFSENQQSLTLFAALFNTLLAYIFYQLLWVSTKSRLMAFGSMILSILYFGTTSFSYYRYYVLSNAYFNYVLYLEIIILILTLTPRKIAHLWFVPLAYYLLQINHKQEALLLIIQIVALWSLLGYNWLACKLSAKIDTRIFQGVFLLAIVGIFISSLVSKTAGVVLAPHVRLFTTLGIYGSFSLILLLLINIRIIPSQLGIAKLPRHTLLIWISLSPILFMFFPYTFSLFINEGGSQGVLYRLIYASFYWTIPLLAVYLWQHYPYLPKLPRLYKFQQNLPVITLLTVVFLAIFSPISYEYWGSRFRDLSYKVPDYQNGHDLKPLIKHLTSLSCRVIISDNYTGQMVMSLTSQVDSATERWSGYWGGLAKPTMPEYESILKQPNYCIVVNLTNTCHSELGRESQHWNPDMCNPATYQSEETLRWINEQQSHFKIIRLEKFIILYGLTPITG